MSLFPNNFFTSRRYASALFRIILSVSVRPFVCPVDEEKYKNYRRLYKQTADATEKAYFKELFDTRSNSSKQLWNNLNSVIFRRKTVYKVKFINLYVG